MEGTYKIKQLFSYLPEKENEKKYAVKNISDYDRLIYEFDIKSVIGCKVNTTLKNDKWLVISKKCRKYYKEFYKLSEEIKNKNDLKIMWGHSMLAWKNKSQAIMHPVFVTPMEITTDSLHSQIILRPCANTEFNAELFCEPDAQYMEKIINLKKEFESGKIDPRKTERVEETIYKLLDIISKNNNMEIQKRIFHMKNMTASDIILSEYPAVYDVPVIFLREDKTAILKNNVNNIINDIDKGCIIPEIIKIMADDDYDLQESKLSFLKIKPEFDYKKVPAILKENCSVVIEDKDIQSKNLIIYNIICESLLQNKKILVIESERGSSKDSILNLISEEIKPLCINALQGGILSSSSIKGRMRRTIGKNILKPDEYKTKVKEFENELEIVRKRECELRDIIRKRKCEQSQKVIKIAQWVKENQYRYGYIEDAISPDAEPPVTEQEMDRLLCILKRTSKNDFYRINEAGAVLDELPCCDEICSKISDFKVLAENYDKYKQSLVNWNIPPQNKCRYDRMLEVLEEAKKQLSSIEGSYLHNVMKDYYSDISKEESIRSLSSSYHSGIIRIEAIEKELSLHKVTLPQNTGSDKFQKDFDLVYDELCRKNSISRIFKFVHKKCLYIIYECKIDGEPINCFEDIVLIKLLFEEKEICEELSELWNNTMKGYTEGKAGSSSEEIIGMRDAIDKIDTIMNWDKIYTDKIKAMLGSIDIPEGMNWKKLRDVDYMINCIKSIKSLNKYEELEVYINVLKKNIVKYKSMVQLYNAIDKLDTEMIKGLYIDVERLKSIKPRVQEANYILGKIRRVCPIFAHKLIAEDKNKIANRCIKWNTVWKWSEWNSRLHGMFEKDVDKLEAELAEEEKKERILLQDILSQKVWYNVSLQNCQGEKDLFCLCIVPAYKAAEYSKIMKKNFDMVIINENPDYEAFELCALMKAEKSVIIGDFDGTVFENLSNRVLMQDSSELKRNVT